MNNNAENEYYRFFELLFSKTNAKVDSSSITCQFDMCEQCTIRKECNEFGSKNYFDIDYETILKKFLKDHPEYSI